MPRSCYFCGSKATSREHIPPKLLFRGFHCDRITVPSCDKHNTQKSGDDQAIVSAFLRSLDYWKTLYAFPYHEDIEKAIRIGRSSFERTKKSVFQTKFSTDPPSKNLVSDIVIVSPKIGVDSWMQQMAAGLTFDALGRPSPEIDWASSEVYGSGWIYTADPNLFRQDDLRRQHTAIRDLDTIFGNVSWLPGWSSKPRAYPQNIYQFHYGFADNYMALKHIFYQNMSVYNIILVPSSSIANLEQKFASRKFA